MQIQNYKTKKPTHNLIAVGFRPKVPMVLWDTDNKTLGVKLKMNDFYFECLYNQATLYHNMTHDVFQHWGIYETKHGYHLVMNTKSWNDSLQIMKDLKRLTQSDYSESIDLARLRLSPKWDYQTGKVVSPAPKLIEGCPHVKQGLDIRRTGNYEIYTTND